LIPGKPLTKYSVATQLQYEYLISEKDEIEVLLEGTFKNKGEIQASMFLKCNGKIWIWTLGAYELVRTMDESRSCFTSNYHERIHELKLYLAKIRVPFAKQEKRGKRNGKRVHANNEWTVYPLLDQKDLGYEIDGNLVSFRDMSNKFVQVLAPIKEQDIIASLFSTFPK